MPVSIKHRDNPLESEMFVDLIKADVFVYLSFKPETLILLAEF